MTAPRSTLVRCADHSGDHRAYIACVHIVLDGAEAAVLIDPADSPDGMGTALCATCDHIFLETNDLPLNDLLSVCERCMAGYVELWQ
jgi:hypothetical protein